MCPDDTPSLCPVSERKVMPFRFGPYHGTIFETIGVPLTNLKRPRMKRITFTPLFSLLILFTACSKSDFPAPPVPDAVASVAQSAPQSQPIITGWETASTWSRSEGANGTLTFSASRSFSEITPDLLESGAVLAFTTGYNLASRAPQKPLGLPFDFYTATERFDQPLHWQFESSAAEARISVNLQPEDESLFAANSGAIRIRYFVLPPGALQHLERTPAQLRNMSYRELTNLLQVAP
jgi:hypothetical protein